ncbi:hypothetical protein MHZ95_06275 [Sporosarcina sp. ACRSM]|uniref:hypothetical protein n=1 Tax=Sporosarcina sp. ACRSM TaxID=2918216 RepID=UPI001EF737BF|nr:hypothetical protein [Sporosarcina sp. ACRSM]MCG7334876.1 hypothetical protein [Sporosarcina sp. ACRSM]
MEKGWSKLHRELVEKPMWTELTPMQKVLLVTPLTMANYGKKHGENSSARKMRTTHKKLTQYEFLTDESTNKNRLLTIVN